MPGYSGTPLPKKLGLAPGARVILVNVPAEVRAKLRRSLAMSSELGTARGPVDFAMVFAVARPDLVREFARAEKRLTPAGMLWACWPKKSSGVGTDLHDEVVREIGIRSGLVDVKVCAITETWSGLKFVRRRTQRPPES
jgi:hypothetical protein